MGTCSGCLGSGRSSYQCSYCYGTGKRDGDRSYGTPSCSHCDGKGYPKCSSCGGTGYIGSPDSSSGSSSDYSSSPSGPNPADAKYQSIVSAFNQAVRFEEQGKYEEALAKYSGAININRKDSCVSITYARRGQLYFRLKRYEEAVNDFVSCLTEYYEALNQESLNAVFNMLDESFNQIGDENRKNEALKRIIDINKQKGINYRNNTGTKGDERVLNWAKGMLKGNNSSSSSDTAISINKTAAFFSAIIGAVALGILPGFDLIRLGIGAIVGLLLVFCKTQMTETVF